jgi:hypothetical protein
MKNARYWILFICVSFLISLSLSGASETIPRSASLNPSSSASGFYIIHWPVNGEYLVYFDGVLAGKIEKNSLIVSRKDPFFSTARRYSVIFENVTVFSDALPQNLVQGESWDIYPNLIQVTPPGSHQEKTSRTLVIHWPEDGAQVYLDGVSEGYQIRDSQFTLEVLGNSTVFPRSVTILPSTTGYEKGPFPIDVIPPEGGQLDFYPYWELSLKNNLTVYRTSSNSTNPTSPVWSDNLGFGGVLASCSGNGNYIAAGSDMGMVRFYDSAGNVLWTYQLPGTPVGYIKTSSDGNLITAAYYYSSPNPARNGSRIIRFDQSGSVIWQFRPDEALRAVAVSDDGNYMYASWGNEVSVIDKNGVVIGGTKLSEPVGMLDASGDGSTCVAAGYRGLPGKISVIDRNGSALFTSPGETDIAGIGISNDGELNAAIDDHTLYVFSRDGRFQWNFTGGPQFRSVSVSSDGNHVAAGSQYYLREFNRTGSPEWMYENINGLTLTNDEWITNVALSNDGRLTIAGISDKVVLFNKTGDVLWEYSVPEWIQWVTSTGDGNYFAATTQSHAFYFNRWGNATIPDPRPTPTPPRIFYNNRSTTPSSQSPIPIALPVLTTGGIIVLMKMVKKE